MVSNCSRPRAMARSDSNTSSARHSMLAEAIELGVGLGALERRRRWSRARHGRRPVPRDAARRSRDRRSSRARGRPAAGHLARQKAVGPLVQESAGLLAVPRGREIPHAALAHFDLPRARSPYTSSTAAEVARGGARPDVVAQEDTLRLEAPRPGRRGSAAAWSRARRRGSGPRASGRSGPPPARGGRRLRRGPGGTAVASRPVARGRRRTRCGPATRRHPPACRFARAAGAGAPTRAKGEPGR